MINRAAVIVRYKQPFVEWINAVDPHAGTKAPKVTLADVNEKNNVYLVEVEDQEELNKWLELNYDILFEEELNGWYTDPALWPKDRSLDLFKKWCSFELHTLVFDTGESPLEDDET
jgi:hypothetical protein